MTPSLLSSLYDFAAGVFIIVSGLAVGTTMIRVIVWFASEVYLNSGG